MSHIHYDGILVLPGLCILSNRERKMKIRKRPKIKLVWGYKMTLQQGSRANVITVPSLKESM